MNATDLTGQGMPDGELLGVVALVVIPLALTLLVQAWRDRKRRTDWDAPSTVPAVRAQDDELAKPVNHLCAFRSHELRLNADRTHWVCLRGDYRAPADEVHVPASSDLPFDQEAADLVAETEAVLRRVAGDVA